MEQTKNQNYEKENALSIEARDQKIKIKTIKKSKKKEL